MPAQKATISIVVPLFNEATAVEALHRNLLSALKKLSAFEYELIYVDDGSGDKTLEIIGGFNRSDSRVKSIRLSRNFGKENALSAGLAASTGEAVITLDGDGQHPPELIHKFVEEWQRGTPVVIGIRTKTEGLGVLKHLASKFFYALFNLAANQKLIPGSTDFRLLDREVVNEFLRLHETDRITRGLIDWLGYQREYIYFTAKSRIGGKETYSIKKLLQLGANSFVSLSPAPLYVFGYLGILITLLSGLLGLAVLIEQILLNDPLSWGFTGTAMLGILIIFLVGLVLISQGVLSLYISHIHNQAKRRPLYIIDSKRSRGFSRKQE